MAKDWAVRGLPLLPGHGGQAGHCHGKQAVGRPAGLLRLAGPRPAAGRQAIPGAWARAEGAGSPGEAALPARGGGVAGCSGSRARAAASVRRHPHRRDPGPGRCRRAAVCSQGRAAPRRQRREILDRARAREAARCWPPGSPSGPLTAARTPAALFTSSRGTRMTTDAIADVIGAITRAAGLDDHVTSHVLRHTFGTELTCRGLILAGYTRRWRWSRRRRWPVPAGPRPAPGTRWRESGSRTRQCRANWPGKPLTAAGCQRVTVSEPAAGSSAVAVRPAVSPVCGVTELPRADAPAGRADAHVPVRRIDHLPAATGGSRVTPATALVLGGL